MARVWQRSARWVCPVLAYWAVLPGCRPAASQKADICGPSASMVNSIGMIFRRIPSGTAYVGSPTDEVYRNACYSLFFDGEDVREADTHELRRIAIIRRGFWLGQTEVTNGQYRRYSADHRSEVLSMVRSERVRPLHANVWEEQVEKLRKFSLNGSRQPVVCVSWDDAQAFCKWLSSLPAEKRARRSYRLPTEIEWEYACRAGCQERFFWGSQEAAARTYANFADASGRRIWLGKYNFFCDDGFIVSAPVGSFQPNAFGLYDMLGNVFELCAETFKILGRDPDDCGTLSVGSNRPAVAARGGCWASGKYAARCAARFAIPRDEQHHDVGFRVVLELAEDKPRRKALPASVPSQPSALAK